MRIVSLLPSATEILFDLGLGDQLLGVSFECDYPTAARSIPVVSRTALPVDAALSAAQIDAEVSTRVAAGSSIYTLDDARLRAIDPDLIIAQDLCRVCAVPSGAVEEALAVIGCRARVLSLDPGTLDEVIDCIDDVGDVTGTSDRASRLTGGLRAWVAAVRRRTEGRARPRVLVLEWADPPFNAGHWVPQMVDVAGGVPLLATMGLRSRRLDWEEILAESVDVTIFAPCGFDLEGALGQAAQLLDQPGAQHLGSIYAVDANAHFSRPGPRLVNGVELLERILHASAPESPEGAMRLV